jgi:hypothetical protein
MEGRENEGLVIAACFALAMGCTVSGGGGTTALSGGTGGGFGNGATGGGFGSGATGGGSGSSGSGNTKDATLGSTGSCSACASGACNTSHECSVCGADSECAAGHVCSSGRCLPPCQAATDCPAGFECCVNRCAETAVDRTACGGCGVTCTGTDYCGKSGCGTTVVAHVCDAPKVTILLDGLPVDDAISYSFRDTLATSCAAAAAVEVVSQDGSPLLNPSSGRPLGRGGDLFVQIGGPWGQHLLKYLENAGISPVFSQYTNTLDGFFGRSTNGAASVIAQAPPGTIEAKPGELNDGHDLFVIETILEPTLGSRTLAIYGLFAPGTTAGAWFFAHQVLPALPTYTDDYYVYEWTDKDGDRAPGTADEFRLVGSGT